MKKLLAAIMALTMLTTMAVQTAFADEESWSQLDPSDGPFVVFGFTDKAGNSVDHYTWDSDEYTVTGSFSRGGAYVEKPYFEDGSVLIKAKPNASLTSEKEVTGKVTVTERHGDRARYTAQVYLYVLPMDELRVREYEDKVFTLPDNYQNGKTRFKSEDYDRTIGTLEAEFVDGGDTVAYFRTKIVDQPSLILAHNGSPDLELMRKYEDADLRFLNWTSAPKFVTTGTLGIIMENGEYLYQVGAENKLSAVSGKYNEDRGTFDIQTSTLGRYVISDIKLSGAGTATTPPPASSTAVTPPPASTKPVTPPPAPSSSVAPPPPPSPSSSEVLESSSEPESSSEGEPAPEISEPESSEPESSSTEAEPEPEDDEGGFPIVPVAIGAGIVLVGGVAAYFIFGNKGGKGGKNYDSWEE